MNRLLARYDDAIGRLDALAPAAVPSLARFFFAAVLFVYYWNSAQLKVGASIFSPSIGAYGQIFPKAMEAVGFDPSQLSVFHTLVVLLGTWAEFLLPVLIVLGLLTRPAALGMIGFVIVQSLTDIFGHGLGGADIGAWFDRQSNAILLDQRGLWVFLLLVLVLKGAGPLSVDALVARFRRKGAPGLAF